MAVHLGASSPAVICKKVSAEKPIANEIEWRIGSVPLVSIPGEAFHEFGRRVEAARGGRALLAGLAPVWQGYLPVPFREGYEEGVSYGEPAVSAILAALTIPGVVTPSA